MDGTPRRYLPINLGLFPKVQTNDLVGGDVDNTFSFALAAGRTARLNGVALALGGNWATDTVKGLQLAVGGNLARADVSGTQMSVGGNWATGEVDGLQMSVGLNVARKGGLAGQMTVGGNVSNASLSGMQLAVGGNWVEGDFGGWQSAVGVNYVKDRMAGLQMAVGLNYAATARGTQLSLLNVGGDVKGMQLGLVNVAGKMNGLQLGIVNVADEMESGVPVGMLSIVRNGQFHVEAFGNDVNFANAAFKVGSRTFYTTVVVGMGHTTGSQGPSHWTLGFGLGAHLPVNERLFVDVDGVTSSVYDWDASFTTTRLWHQVRVIGGFQITKRFSVIGGPTMNLMHGVDGDAITGLSSFSREGPKHFIWWPGVQLGVRL
jgi:hypothetical protein